MTLQSDVPNFLQNFVTWTLQVFKVHEESDARDWGPCNVKVRLSWKILDHLLSDAASHWNVKWIILHWINNSYCKELKIVNQDKHYNW